jgi:predicted transcriptional regulator
MAARIKSEQEQRLRELADQSGLSANEFLERELDSILAYREDLVAAVKRGDEDIAAGRLLSNEKVFARIEERLKGR